MYLAAYLSRCCFFIVDHLPLYILRQCCHVILILLVLHVISINSGLHCQPVFLGTLPPFISKTGKFLNAHCVVRWRLLQPVVNFGNLPVTLLILQLSLKNELSSNHF